MSLDKSRRLGRGLEALLATKAAVESPPDRGALRRLPIAQIRPNPYQPRKEFRAEETAELEASLRSSGLLQPVAVRELPGGAGYELIAGERRLRAATNLGWTDIPAVVKEIDDRTLLSLALVENLQRTDLNPLEEASGYQRLIEEFSLTQQQVSELIGKDRSTIANMLRLLNLPASVRRMLQDGELTLGHARALLALGDERQMTDLAREIVMNGLTVRDVERRARESIPGSQRKPRSERARGDGQNAEARRIEDDLRKHLQTDVRVKTSGGQKGAIEIAFYSADDLERILEIMLGHGRG
ncbi:MAG TPA: ParB/RepB/Spo0J family partition protein [Gemmatimonadaceae bacterium]|nr:ParB/RepB/Spo0J family partition protein [Gemmatimonadaceae bacterium]